MEPLVQVLGPEVVARFSEMRTLSAEWHQRVADVRAPPGPAAILDQIPYERDLYLRTLEVDPAGENGREGWAVVRVRDTGPGIPPEHRERIFEEFHRIPGTGAHGHGLDLAVSRRLARLLGGDLTVESGEDGGSTFALRLPARVAARDPQTTPG